ncbi:MAG: glycosyltransferase family 2 protein [Bacteroidales bacterium]|nr:glycosyltransferase family 2 protein [Bacteroidales bacterium]
MKNLVSIITPSYNSTSFISETIESVLAQTYDNWEMTIIDDASQDNSVDIIENFVKADARITLIKLDKNVGAGDARNRGIEKARGKYIAFLDSDDVWHEEKLEIQIKLMEDSQTPISFTGYTIMDEPLIKSKSIINVPQSVDLKEYLKTTIIGMSTAIINRDIVGEFKLSSIRTRQDGVLWIELLKKGYTAIGLNMQLTKYRSRKNSISANKLKAIKRIWYIYRKYAGLNLFYTFYYFMFYIINNIQRRYFQ